MNNTISIIRIYSGENNYLDHAIDNIAYLSPFNRGMNYRTLVCNYHEILSKAVLGAIYSKSTFYIEYCNSVTDKTQIDMVVAAWESDTRIFLDILLHK